MSLNAKIESLNGERVTLVFDDGQKLVVPAAFVDGAAKVWQDVAVVVEVSGSEDSGRARVARELLNELLKA